MGTCLGWDMRVRDAEETPGTTFLQFLLYIGAGDLNSTNTLLAEPSLQAQDSSSLTRCLHFPICLQDRVKNCPVETGAISPCPYPVRDPEHSS